MKKHILTLSAFSLLLSSCTTTALMKSRNVKSMDIYNSGVLQRPLAVDLEIQKEKVSATASGQKSLGVEYIKQTAMANAIREAEADILVEPIFEVTDNEKTVTVTVTAFAGVYKNFRNTTLADSSWLRHGTFVTAAKTSETAPVLVKKKGKAGAIILGILAGLGAVALIAAAAGA